MKASKFTEAQKAFILKRGEEGTSVAEICRKGRDRAVDLLCLEGEVWRPAARRDAAVAAPGDENARLKRIVADLTLDRQMLRGMSFGESSEAGTIA